MESSLRAPRAFWSALRATPDGEVPAVCARGGHVLHVPGLRLQTRATRDLPIIQAAGSDPNAQRWLGWRPENLVPEGRRERLLAGKPGRGRILSQRNEAGGHWLVAVDPEGGRLAGFLFCDRDAGEIGGTSTVCRTTGGVPPPALPGWMGTVALGVQPVLSRRLAAGIGRDRRRLLVSGSFFLRWGGR